MADLANLSFQIDSSPLARTARELRQMGEAGKRAGGDVKRASTIVNNAMLGIVGVAGGAAAAVAAAFSVGAVVTEAKRLDSALREVSTLIEGTAGQMGYLESKSRELSRTFGGSATAQAQAFYQAISAGATSVEAAAETLEVANKLAIGGITDVTTGVDILTTAMNVYAAEGLKASDASDALFVAMRAGKTDIGQLASSLAAVLPLSETLGVSFDETAAATAALTKGGIATSEAVTGLRAALTSVLGPSAEAEKLADKLGINFSTAGIEAKGFAGFMEDVVEKTGGSATAIQTLFGSVEATTVALAFAGQSGEFLAEILGQMEEKAGATQSAFDKMSDSAEQRLSKAMARLMDIGTSFGSVLLTVAVPALEAAASVMEAVASNADVIAISLGVLSASYIPTMIAGVTSAVVWLGTMEGMFIAGAVASRALTVAMRALPFVGAITAATLLYRGYRNLIEATGSFGGAMSLLGDIAQEVWQRMGDGGRGLYLIVSGAAKGIGAAFMDAFAWIGSKWDALINGMSKPFNDIMESLGLDARIGASAIGEELGGIAAAWESEAVGKIEQGGALLKAAATTPLESLAALKTAVSESTAEIESEADAAETASDLTKRLAGALAGDDGKGGAAGAAGKLSEEAKAAKKSLDELRSAAESWTDSVATPVEEYVEQIAELERIAANSTLMREFPRWAEIQERAVGKLNRELREGLNIPISPIEEYQGAFSKLVEAQREGVITSDEFAKGMKSVNVELADSMPLVGELTDTITEGLFNGFEDTLSSIKNIFKRWLIYMIAAAAKNQIIVSMGLNASGTGAIGGALGSGLASGLGSVMGGLGATLGGLGKTFFSNAIGIFGADMAGLGATLAGATSSLTGFAAAAGALALPIAGAVAAFDFFRTKTKTLDQGIRISADGMAVAVEQWEEIRKSRFWGLSTSRSTNFEGADKAIANPLAKAVGEMQTGIMQAADALGVGKRAFRDFSHEIMLSTEGMTEEQALQALQDELTGLGNSFARMVPGVHSLRMEGESAADALTRTATTLTAVNAAFKTLGFDRLDESLRGGKVANRLVEMSGGLQQFATATEFYFQNIMSAPDRLKALTKQFREALDAGGIVNMPTSTKAFQTQVEKLMDTGALNKATSLINLAPLFTQIQQLQAELDTTGNKASTAAERLAAREKRAEDAARRAEARQNERAGLQTQIWQLLGNENKLREQALADLAPMNRAMQERIWRIQDEQAATEKANAIADERLGIQRQIWSLTGNTTAIERDLLASLNPANRALQQQVFTLEKQAEATERANAIADERLGLQRQIWEAEGNTAAIRRDILAQLDPTNRALQSHLWTLEAQAEAAERASAIADERTSLEDRLLELQGNTAELRRRELAGLDASNRSLQLMIYGLEDAAKAMEDLDPAAFATKLDYERARARAVSGVGGVTSTGVPLAVVPSVGPQPVESAMVDELRAIRKELADLRTENRQLKSNGNADLRKLRTIEERREATA